MSNLLYIHNGNQAVKQWMGARHPSHTIMPCITVTWTVGNLVLTSIDAKLEFLRNNSNIICDLSAADELDPYDLARFKSCCEVIKVFSTLENDLENLEDVWNPALYNYTQWLRCTIMRLSFADQLLYFNDHVSIGCKNELGPMMFSPGRTGSYFLSDIINVRNAMHHNDDTLSSEKFQELLSSNKVYSILRKDFGQFTMSSQTAMVTNSYMLTKRDQVELRKTEVDSIQPFEVSADHYKYSFATIANFLDLLLAIKIVWNKPVCFCLYEDHLHHSNKTNYTKNPYNYQTIISNYTQAVDINQEFQPYYNLLLNRAISVLGLTHF